MPNSLKKITINNGTRISDLAFYGMRGLTEVVLPDTIENVGKYAFVDCESETCVIFKGNAPTFDNEAFLYSSVTVCYPNGNQTRDAVVNNSNFKDVTWINTTPLEITEQPVNTMVPSGSLATVSVTATGDGMTYKWYYKNAGAITFIYTSTFQSNIYSITMDASRAGRQVYCVITDKYGNSVTTNTVTLSMK